MIIIVNEPFTVMALFSLSLILPFFLSLLDAAAANSLLDAATGNSLLDAAAANCLLDAAAATDCEIPAATATNYEISGRRAPDAPSCLLILGFGEGGGGFISVGSLLSSSSSCLSFAPEITLILFSCYSIFSLGSVGTD